MNIPKMIYRSLLPPYQLKFNVWSAEKWINGPPEPDVEAVYLIDWIRFTPYTSKVAASPAKHFSNKQVRIISGPERITLECRPESTVFTSQCRLYLLDGSCFTPEKQSCLSGKSLFTFSSVSFPSGCYFYQIRSGDDLSAGRFIFHR